MREGDRYVCSRCGVEFPVTLERVACDCGGVLDLGHETLTSLPEWDDGTVGMLRYAPWLAIPRAFLSRASLGIPPTPLVELSDRVFAKCDFISPSGSFKDRGALALTALALSLSAARIVLDSSGNAGAAMAAHCARVNLPCHVVVPASAPPAKLSQSRAYGAHVITVEGGRPAAARLARSLAGESGTFYASHVENPFFLEGTATWGLELVDQLGDAPERVVMAVGNGSLFIGAYLGFRRLYECGLGTRIPRMVAVQARGWSPLSGDLGHGAETPLADGIAIEAPRRLDEILSIIASTGGEVRVVDVGAIGDATRDLALRGLWVEPTSGAAWAALSTERERHEGTTVLSLGGAGFKSAAAWS